ncbi:hypothetical protein BaRGS_00020432, partial [Batillaria attramentaria]
MQTVTRKTQEVADYWLEPLQFRDSWPAQGELNPARPGGAGDRVGTSGFALSIDWAVREALGFCWDAKGSNCADSRGSNCSLLRCSSPSRSEAE